MWYWTRQDSSMLTETNKSCQRNMQEVAKREQSTSEGLIFFVKL